VTVEQRLVHALRSADRVEPSADLWSRVVHSIEEDRVHRRRVVVSTITTAAMLAVLTIIGAVGLTDGPEGRYVRLPVLQFVQLAVLVALVAVLGPAIRRFGRGYATDLWRSSPSTASILVTLLDLAYVLVFAGYIMLTTLLDLDTSDSVIGNCRLTSVDCADYLPDQMRFTAFRIGGLVLVMGVLHAVTIVVLPAVALVSNSTRVGRALPRWFVVLLAVAGVGVGFALVNGLMGGLIGMAGS
jgi:hypothetical protein